MMKYIKPIVFVENLEAEKMMALSLLNGEANDSEVLVNEQKNVETTDNDVWSKEW